MKQHSIHTAMIQQVAERLGPLRPKVVFLGGSATGFHITDKAEPEIRATKDVDIIVEVASIVGYHKLEKTLRELGFFQKMQEDDPICRWYIDDVIVDVMPTDENILGFSNRWYLPAIKNSVTIELEPNLEIQIVTAPYFIGTKLEAFFGRGRGDYLTSHDMEDIINFINGRVEILEDIENSEPDLKTFIIKSLQGFLEDELFLEALPGHLLPDQASQGRRSIILERIKKIVGLDSN
jgi:predicted nucleotidyltransferase